MKKQEANYTDIKGLITDVNINVNHGNPTFQNLYKTPIGKLSKRKGWKTIMRYSEQSYASPIIGRDVSNIKIDFTRITTGVFGIPNIECFHARSLLSSSGTADYNYIDYLYNRIVDGQNKIYLARVFLNSPHVQTANVEISKDGNWTGKGNIKFIETPEQVYIISDFRYSVFSSTVFKYDYARNSQQLNENKMHNISISKALPCFITPIAPGAGKVEAGMRRYKILPVYNTGTIGRSNIISGELKILTLCKINLKIYSTYDPYIKYLRVYRQKANAKTTDPYYFVYQIAKPSDNAVVGDTISLNYLSPATEETVGGVVVSDNYSDAELGTELDETQYVNSVDPLWQQLIRGSVMPSKIYAQDYGMKASCGCFAQNRLFLAGDRTTPSVVYVSKLNNTDAFDTTTYTLPLASLDNEIKAIEEVGNNIFIWLEHGFYVLRPTFDVDVPFTLELITPTIGCDGVNSVCILDGIAYFMFNNKLWALNEYGQYKEISGAINTLLDDKDTITLATVILKSDPKNRCVKIMYRKASNEAVNIDYFPVFDMFAEHKGNKDIFTVSGSTATLAANEDRFKLANYEYCGQANTETGIDIDGNFLLRDTDWRDTSYANSKQTWNDYAYSGANPTNIYNVYGVMEKPWAFSAAVRANAVVIFGNGSIDVSWRADTGTWTDYVSVTMTRTGVTVPLGIDGHIISVRLRHTANTDIDYDLMKLVYTQKNSVDITNDVLGGT